MISLQAQDVTRALDGCRRIYFGMSVSRLYLEATVTAAAVARELGNLEVFVNISQLTVSRDEPHGDDRLAPTAAALAG